MEKSTSNRQQKQEQALEEAYRRGYHHGQNHTRELLLHLLNEGMPPGVALELCRVFEEHIVIPWRMMDRSTSSAPPLFDVEECQRLLRADKERQSEGSS